MAENNQNKKPDERSVEGLRAKLAIKEKELKLANEKNKAYENKQILPELLGREGVDYSKTLYYVKGSSKADEGLPLEGEVQVSIPAVVNNETKKIIKSGFTTKLLFVRGRAITNNQQVATACAAQLGHFRLFQIDPED